MISLCVRHTKNEAADAVSSKLTNDLEGYSMGKRNKSNRFVQQGKDTVNKHDERIPYHLTYAEAEAQKMANVHESSLGGV